MPNLSNFLIPFGFDIFCIRHKFLVYNLVGRNLKVRYRQSVLGILWTLLLPLMNGALLYVVFQFIVKIKMPHYLVYILSGTLPWAFFSTALTDGMDSLRGHAALISKMPLPLQIFPLVTDITGFVNLLFALPIIFGAALISGVALQWPLLLLPYLLLLFFVMAYGFGLLASFASVYAEDLRHLMTVVLQIWFYATPIIYDVKMLPPSFAWIMYANPLCALFVCLRMILIDGVFPPWSLLACSTGWAAVVTVSGAALYRTYGRRIPENL